MAEETQNSKKITDSRSTMDRRSALKGLGLAGVSFMLPDFLRSAAFGSSNLLEEVAKLKSATQNPKWYGFNLLEYFSTDPDWMKYFPYKNDGMFLEDDFRWISDWGFNWVRLPMDYRFWTESQDLLKIREKDVLPIDRAIKLGEKYGVHVNLCLHRAPGYCILDTMNEALTGIHITKEKGDLFTDQKMLDAFVYQWTYFTNRYKGISSKQLSFNLVNEPLIFSGTGEIGRDASSYAKVARTAVAAIKQQDAQRLVITDGFVAGNAVIPELFDTGMMQSCHTYTPMPVTHYQCEWARGILTGKEPLPTWPLKTSDGKTVNRQFLENLFAPWGEAGAHVPIHFGEMGCYKHTPPDVVLAWFEDTLGTIGNLHYGWALWNFRGPFGVLDTERKGTKYEDWHGHALDRALLILLQKKMTA